ncbi:MAG: serine hydrolase domain-containing protein [Hyphomicrobiales bacterium]
MFNLGRLTLICCVLALAAGLVVVPASADDTTRDQIANKLRDLLQSYQDANQDKEGFSAISASISLGPDTPTIDAAVGRVSREASSAAVTPQSLFEIGSITKSITAAIVLELADEGSLSLDAPIGTWLPEYPAWKDLTIRRLLSMTSGIPSYDDTEAFAKAMLAAGGDRYFSTAQLVSFVDPTLAGSPPPTTGYSYSNTNFILTQMIIERVTGTSFADHVRRRILTGHGLNDTFYSADRYPDSVSSRLVSGYLANLAPEQKTLEPLVGKDLGHAMITWGQAAGGAVATPADITRWARLLFTGPILDGAQRKELTGLVSMKTGQPIADVSTDDPQAFGLGVHKSMFGKDQMIWAYEGETMSMRALYTFFPKHDLVVAVAVNSSSSTVDRLGHLAADIYAAVTGDTATVDAAEAQPAN